MKRPATPISEDIGLGCFPFARRYLGNHFCFLFLRVLRCFSSPGCLLISYLFRDGYAFITKHGFPHSDIPGSMLTYSSPRHFGVRSVLHRLLAPRHPPCALCILTFVLLLLFFRCIYFSLSSFQGAMLHKIGGAKRDRTADLLLARQALSQLSYSPMALNEKKFFYNIKKLFFQN